MESWPSSRWFWKLEASPRCNEARREVWERSEDGDGNQVGGAAHKSLDYQEDNRSMMKLFSNPLPTRRNLMGTGLTGNARAGQELHRGRYLEEMKEVARAKECV